jgi:hypothetical protein
LENIPGYHYKVEESWNKIKKAWSLSLSGQAFLILLLPGLKTPYSRLRKGFILLINRILTNLKTDLTS